MKLGDVVQAMKQVTKSEDRLSATMYEDAGRYLQSFGYVDACKSVKDAIKKAQAILQLKPDGKLGPLTVKAMQTVPRCGCKDVMHAGGGLNRWSRDKADRLVYTVKGYVRQLSKTRQEEILVRCWEHWEKVCNVKVVFKKNASSSDVLIDVSASRREEFGRVGNVLAWAYVPQGNNNTKQLIMKFDLAENWTELMFEKVATHEIGHLWGIGHTDIRGELMYPTLGNVKIPQSRFDIPQAVSRYGKPIKNSGGETTDDSWKDKIKKARDLLNEALSK